MPVELREIPSTRVDRIGHTGSPIAGPVPAEHLPAPPAQTRRHADSRDPHTAGAANRTVERTMLLLGRAIFGGYFTYSGINHFLNAEPLSQYARTKQVPLAKAAVTGSGAMLLLGGLSLLTGYRPKIGASLISGFLLGVTPQMHDFWNVDDEQQRMNEFIHFTKNAAMIGGACFAAAAAEPWPFSVRSGEQSPVTA
jgi:putative oxidoreductase